MDRVRCTRWLLALLFLAWSGVAMADDKKLTPEEQKLIDQYMAIVKELLEKMPEAVGKEHYQETLPPMPKPSEGAPYG